MGIVLVGGRFDFVFCFGDDWIDGIGNGVGCGVLFFFGYDWWWIGCWWMVFGVVGYVVMVWFWIFGGYVDG